MFESKTKYSHAIAWLLMAALLAIAVADSAEAAKKRKKKPKKSKEPQSAEQVLTAVEVSLLAYATDDARAQLDTLSAADTARVAALWGRVMTQEKRYDEAVTKLQEAAAAAASDPSPLLLAGKAHAYAERPFEAQQAFNEAVARANALLQLNPDDADALSQLGNAQTQLRQLDLAIPNLERAVALQPGDPLKIYHLGLAKAYRQDWQAAVDLLTQALELNSGIAYAYYYRGLAADKIGRKDLLVNDLDRFLVLAPEAPEAERAQKILDAARG